MKLKFSNGATIFFSDIIEPEERLAAINELLRTDIIFDNQTFTVESYFRYTWNETGTINNLERIGLYLSKMPEQNGKHDKDVFSRNDEMELTKGVRWTTRGHKKVLEKARYVNLSETSLEDKINLGINDIEDLKK